MSYTPDKQKNTFQQGFTLIELSIVLVIIGLIVGGILVGQTLVHSAAQRSVVTQIERFNTAVNTFRVKYNALPGDMTSDIALQFGFATRTGNTGQGDGDGLIESGTFSSTTKMFGETAMFWSDLATASLIPGSFPSDTYNASINAAWLENHDTDTLLAYLNPISDAEAFSPVIYPLSTFLPKSSFGNNNYFTVFSANSTNYFQLTIVTGINSGVYSIGNNLSPADAYAIDAKIDDGLPGSGRLQAMEGTSALNNAATPGTTSCVSSANTPPTYNIGGAYDSVTLCQLRFQFQ